MSNKSKRTHPLDRDGDGELGGSLQGNQTAPMADGEQPADPANPIPGATVQPSAHVQSEDAEFVEPADAATADDQDDDDTFDAEQVEAAATAGEGAVMAEEGETVADAADATAPAELIAVDDGERQVAVRVRELRILLGARRLYKSAEGYSASFGAPFIDQATVDAWLAAGLADAVPSAGNQGGVRATAKARQALAEAQTPQVAE
ncbi:MAG: hypothetical protein KJ728_11790 [Alphaproteobacteria bacterium]|uniref:Uncharacterized protein n=1 Tax=viral metagenome TaxID=1070528 RepID=A0A6M3XBH9_9ZZZZ|nr:hypothetical protein [Alphaproteobacteria bacterium]